MFALILTFDFSTNIFISTKVFTLFISVCISQARRSGICRTCCKHTLTTRYASHTLVYVVYKFCYRVVSLEII